MSIETKPSLFAVITAILVLSIGTLVVADEYDQYNKHWQSFIGKVGGLQGPFAIIESDREVLFQKAVDVIYSAVVYGVGGTISYLSCYVVGRAVATLVAGPVVGTMAGPLAGTVCTLLTFPHLKALSRHLHNQILNWKIHPDAELVGAFIGMVAGAYVAVPLIQNKLATMFQKLWYADYASYVKAVRATSNTTARASKHIIDPKGLRGFTHGYDLHHIFSIKCGWEYGVPVWVMAMRLN